MNLTPVHRSSNPKFTEEINRLEELGWYQEHYIHQANLYARWTIGIWNHEWLIVKDICLLCHSAGEVCLQVQNQSICLKCLNEFPNTPWHPTGILRSKVSTLIRHTQECNDHLQSSDSSNRFTDDLRAFPNS